ncbi:DUF3501 family protein [Teredinibacter sp. KSP-S5-2]|uniref:DUF3501 family protein n=1 Tax=Teredinibacter sp. KSP-S5-2 TaxID=3034506 RepID=UPI00293525C2|nr:DUF3501 family protein [Teredinibacter sp. KSP-S5-2]WNO09068.1 DUF3501 family protein [Teredinibacter sp. KSP-S5-2]
MHKLYPSDLWSIEIYSAKRHQFQQQVGAHKKNRQIVLGDCVTVTFEDEVTVRYRIQELIRSERIIDKQQLQHELDLYNPLIPNGNNWKCTVSTTFSRTQISHSFLDDIEGKIWLTVDGCAPLRAEIRLSKVQARLDDKPATLRYLQFDLTKDMITKLQHGSPLFMGVDHPGYWVDKTSIGKHIVTELVTDLASIN